MEFTVRDLGSTESKSVQEVEQQLLDEHQQQLEGAQEPPVEVVDEPTPTPPQEDELDEQKFFHIWVNDTVVKSHPSRSSLSKEKKKSRWMRKSRPILSTKGNRPWL